MNELEKLKKQLNLVTIERDQLYDCLKDMQSRMTRMEVSRDVPNYGSVYYIETPAAIRVEYNFDEELFTRIERLLEYKTKIIVEEIKETKLENINKYDFINKK